MCDDANADNTDACLNTCAAATCGDGFVRAGVEMCDDANADNTDACLNTCAAATCGDSFIQAGVETCDDSNTAAGDCCSSACGIEAGCEVEPNGTAAQSAAGVVFPQSGVIKAMIKPIGDVDFLAINVTARIDLKIETFEGFAPGACPTIDTVTELRAPNGTTILVNNDDSGINSCSLIDPAVDAGARGLNPGTYYVRVIEYQSNALIPAYNVQLTVVATCGNGIKEGSEYCDDGNTLNGDGCTSICKLETTPEVEPNNTCGTANGPYPLTPAPGVFYSGAITPIGDFDWFSFTVPATADLYIETFDVNGPPTCASIDTEIQVFKSDCVTTLTAVQDQGGVGNCSRLDPAVNAQVRHVPPGTYIVKVNERLNDATISGYTLNVRFTALCGNGVVEGFEECDGGATCDANCDRIPVCGDGFVDAPETCDDANANPGDGCTAACSSEAGFACSSAGGPCTPICGDGQIKGSESCDDSNSVNGDGCDSSCRSESPPTLEVEPNSTFAEADLRAADATPILINGTSTTIAGAITPLADKDIFKMTLAAPSLVRFETFDATGSGCSTALQTTTLRLFNSALAPLYTDNTSGISSCSAMVVFLTAGTYYVQVEETGNNALLAGYRLQVKVQASVGSESEPNSTLLQSDPLPGSDVFILGGHQVNADADYFAITVPAGKSLRAEIVEGSLAETCESSGIDSRLTLFNAAGTQLVEDDDDGRGFCSLIDGTGATALDAGAKALAAGTYYLLVRASTLGTAPTGPSGQFDYSLVVTLR
jgi:cysteine-rich repeat protein